MIRSWILRGVHCILRLLLLQRYYWLGVPLPLLLPFNAPPLEGHPIIHLQLPNDEDVTNENNIDGLWRLHQWPLEVTKMFQQKYLPMKVKHEGLAKL